MSARSEIDDGHIEALVAKYVAEQVERCRAELHAEMVAVANKLRQDDAFMKPVAQKFTDHAGDHLFDKAARRLLLLVLGVFGAGLFGLFMWLGGRGFK